MNGRSIFRGVFWTVVALALVFHIGGGWYYSGVLIEDGFVPDPDPIVTVSGDYELVEVEYPTEAGNMLAWHLPAAGDTWVIHVHGKGATPAEAEHLFGPLQDAGYPQLSIAYRNDDGEPLDPSGYYQYGATEYADVAAAFDFAQANGARYVVLSGFSTGASHILSFVYRSNLDDVRGLVFDSPNIDLGSTVDYNASQRELPLIPANVPVTLTWVAKFMTSLRMGVNWQVIDYVEKTEGRLRVPTLVQHGTEDTTVPLDQSLEFAEAAPDVVRLVSVPGAGHVGLYEADPEKYVGEVLAFLDSID